MPANTVDTGTLAKLFDITERQIQRLVINGVLQRARDEEGRELRGRFELVYNVRGYCKYLREQARLDDASESMYVRLRNQKMAAEAEQASLRLAMFKGRLHRAEDVEFIITQIYTALKARILSIPSRTTRLLIGKTDFQAIYDLQMRELEAALSELVEINAAMFHAQNEQYIGALFADAPIQNGHSSESEKIDDLDVSPEPE